MERTASPPTNALPPGTRLGEFEVLDLLGVGGFGIVYRALDHALEREVAIKEYMPAMLAGRTETLHVSLRSQSDAEVFETGRRSFVNEAKLLARFDHPALVKVYRFWEANGTAYMAMPIYRGPTLKQARQALGGPPDEAWVRALLMPLLSALERLHAEGVYHRDIAPDNILIEPDVGPVLLDFGAARRVIGDRSQNLTAILKPAYAPIEQYAEASAGRQGPWTDLYALGATLHHAIVGQAPPPATSRMLHDDLQPLAARELPGLSLPLRQAVDWMLALRPADRPQSVGALRAVIDGRAPAPVAPPPPPAAPWEPTRVQPPAADAMAATMLDLGTPDLTLPDPSPAPQAATPPAPATATAPTAPRAGRAMPLALGGLLLAAAAGWGLWPAPAPAPLAGPAETPPPAASAPSPAIAVNPVNPVNPVDGATSAPVVAAPPPAARTVPASPPPPAAESPVRAAPAVSPRPVAPPPAPADTPTLAARPVDTRSEAASPVRPPAAEPAPRTEPPRPAAATSSPAAPPVALSDDPSAICGKRVLVAQLICMERECRKPELSPHPACRKWYATRPAQQP